MEYEELIMMFEIKNSGDYAKTLAEICAAMQKKDGLKPIDISGKYSVNSTAEIVTIEQNGIECLVSSTDGWKGKGCVISDIYRGTYEYPGNGTGEHLMLVTKDKNLVGIWHSETHGSEKIEWIKNDGKFIPYPPRSGDAYDMNAPFEEH